jgi:hypothetical protein
MRPTLGRIVHYMSLGSADGKYPPEPHPALVTAVDEEGDTISLCVFYRTGNFFMEKVKWCGNKDKGCWFWPERTI